MKVTEGQIVTVEVGGERADYVVTGLRFDYTTSDGSRINPREMTLLRIRIIDPVPTGAGAA